MADTWEKPENSEAAFTENMAYGLSHPQLERIKRTMIPKQVGWVAGMSDGLLGAGAVSDIFRVQSLNKPGILTAYFQGNPYMTSLSRSYFSYETPPSLGGQMDVFNFPENNSVSLTTIGPKYSPSDTPQMIASDFLGELTRLIREESLSRDSAFTQELSSVLQRLAQSLTSPQKQLAELVQKPTSELERQIYQAIKMSLD